MNYKIQSAGDPEAGEWDEFIVGQPGWTHFHRFGWRRVISGAFKHESHYLMAHDPAGKLLAVLPLVRVRSMIFGDFMVSMPFLNYGGPLGDEHAQEALVNHALQLAAQKKADLLELRCREEKAFGMKASTRKVTVLLDLPSGGSQPLWNSLDSKVRSQVRRPMKDGVTMKFGAEHLDDFFRVFAHHMRDLGTPVLPANFFRLAQAEFGDTMWIGVAYLKDEPIACGCGFTWGDEFEMTWASSLRRYGKLAPNMLLYWSFIERAIEQGLHLFNFGRCTPGGGTHKFKRQWNSRDEQLWWYQQSRSGTVSTPSPDGKYSLGPRIWRHLPVRLATVLGPRVVRYIP